MYIIINLRSLANRVTIRNRIWVNVYSPCLTNPCIPPYCPLEAHFVGIPVIAISLFGVGIIMNDDREHRQKTAQERLLQKFS